MPPFFYIVGCKASVTFSMLTSKLYTLTDSNWGTGLPLPLSSTSCQAVNVVTLEPWASAFSPLRFKDTSRLLLRKIHLPFQGRQYPIRQLYRYLPERRNELASPWIDFIMNWPFGHELHLRCIKNLTGREKPFSLLTCRAQFCILHSALKKAPRRELFCLATAVVVATATVTAEKAAFTATAHG